MVRGLKDAEVEGVQCCWEDEDVGVSEESRMVSVIQWTLRSKKLIILCLIVALNCNSNIIKAFIKTINQWSLRSLE